MHLAFSDTAKGFAWATAGTLAATGTLWLFRFSLDKGQASLLYLPVVIACALRFGFAPALAGAILSFLCWDFFFLPPFHQFLVSDPRDWLSLVIFLIAAMTTAWLASEARRQTEAAQTREHETRTLYEAGEAISSEIEAARLLPALAERIVQACRATRCVVLRRTGSEALLPVATFPTEPLSPEDLRRIAQLSQVAAEHFQVIGFGTTRHLWEKALEGMGAPGEREPKGSEIGVYVPLRAQGSLVGALHVGPRSDGRPFTEQDQRLILALANYAAVVIARQTLADEAAQAAALREADTLKDALLSLVSHELRTPLAAIKAAASGLRSRGAVWPEAARAEAVETIDVEADRLTTLVSNLLDLSRLEAGAWNPSKDWCDLLEIVGTALDRLPEPDADRVQVTTGDDLPLIRADYVQIALVLTNLLGNAAKYTPSGSPIHVSLSLAETTPPVVRVDVRDFGEGITSGDEEAIFTRFHRSARHAGGTVHGTGLGLALCRAVIGAHGGCIWARDAPHSGPPGAIFSFSLPIE
jgi:two-component system sensor histidine kinase KdpD